MGFWGSTLYSNDCTIDVRDDYKQYLLDCLNNEEAFQKVTEAYADRMKTDEEPLVWYALADTQWKLGRLMPEVKEKALWWIENDGGLKFWEDSSNQGTGWKKTLEKLKAKLNTPQPPEKKIKKPAPFVKNPWNAGDVYAYCFHTKEARENGYYGKYILIQKLGDQKYLGETYSFVQVFDKLYDEIPLCVAQNMDRILPFDTASRFMPSGRYPANPKINLYAIMTTNSNREYPRKHLSYVCNSSFPVNLYKELNWSSVYSWGTLERVLLCYFPMWQGYTYELLENETIVTPICPEMDTL